jgi:hypothetical protein
MDDRETRLLWALVAMTRQYLQEREGGLVDSLAMSAGEAAIETLAEYGLMEVVPSGRILGRWTQAGHELWISCSD